MTKKNAIAISGVLAISIAKLLQLGGSFDWRFPFQHSRYKVA
jgi:hypothetical protein